MLLLLKGMVIGFSIAAPVGPIGLLCLQRSLQSGKLTGFVSGLGAATADAVYGTVAATGLGAVMAVLMGQEFWLRLGGGIFLLYLGLTTWRAAPPAMATPVAGGPRLLAAFGSTFGLTLTNPLTALAFLGIFAGVGAGATGGGAEAAVLLVAGVFLGSAAWWLFLSQAAGWLRGRLEDGRLRLINRLAGATIAGFGAWQLAMLAS